MYGMLGWLAALVMAVSGQGTAALPQLSCSGDAVAIPGGIVHGNTAYVANSDSTVEALELLTGRSLWHAAVSAVPIGFVNERVVAVRWATGRANAIRVSFLVSAKGTLAFETSDIDLPAWVARARLDDGTVTFSAVGSGGHTTLEWRAMSPTSHGANPELGSGVAQSGTGAFEIDTTTERVTPVNVSATASEPANLPASSSYWRGARLSSRAWMVAGDPFGLSRSVSADGTVAIVLNRKTGAQTLASGPAPTAWLSQDGKTIFVGESNQPTARVTAFDVLSGDRLAAARYNPTPRTFRSHAVLSLPAWKAAEQVRRFPQL